MARGELPQGVVTFLFTDIEGSTERAATLGDARWAVMLDAHNATLRPVFAEHNGVEVKTEGDAFFVAFGDPVDAVEAATSGQRALETAEWADASPVRVRMGIHTGEALVRDGDYVGFAVHKAKRICDAGHGGQVLISSATASRVDERRAREIGLHRLKDLGEPERLFQLIGEGLPSEFPPLRSLEAFAHNLPAERSAFIGRTDQLSEVRALVAKNRLVTITGVGGCGKTRMALRVAADELGRYESGAFFVDLSTVVEADGIARAIADAIGMPDIIDVTDLDRRLAEHLADRDLLIVLDNCEHLLDGCAAIVDQLLASTGRVTIITTSRESLDIEGEQTWRIPSFSDEEAAELFASRARLVEPGFEIGPANADAVREICRRLDGIPLAIEFAAARVAHMSPQEIAERLTDMFRLLTGGRRRVQRQQTLAAALDWSYDLLEDHEQLLLRRLAVFPASFAMPAAEAICADDALPSVAVALGSLVGKSLVVTIREEAASIRYRLLETVRAYAEEKLHTSGEAEDMRSRHRDHYYRWIDAIPHNDAWIDLTLYSAFEAEAANIRAAVAWSITEGRRDIVGRMAGQLAAYLPNTGQYDEFSPWVDFALADDTALDPDDRVELMAARAFVALMRSQPDGLALAREAIDAGEGRMSFGLGLAMGVVGIQLANLAAARQSPDVAAEARRWFDELEALAAGDLELYGWEWAWIAGYRSNSELIMGDLDRAIELQARAQALAPTSGSGLLDHPSMRASRASNEALLHHLVGDDQRALAAAERAVDLMREATKVARVRMAGLLEIGRGAGCAIAFARADRWLEARTIANDNLSMAIADGGPLIVNDALITCAAVAYLEGDYPSAARLFATARNAGGAATATPPFRSASGYAIYRHYVPLLREALEPDDIGRYREEGKTMTLEEAAQYAFDRSSAPLPSGGTA